MFRNVLLLSKKRRLDYDTNHECVNNLRLNYN